MQRFLNGATTYLRGIQLISQYGLGIYVWIPVLLSFVLGLLVLGVAWRISDDLGGWLIGFYPFEWGRAVFEKVATVMGGVSLVAFTLLLFRYIIMAAASPFMSLLSEQLERKMFPDRPQVPFRIGKMLKDLVRGIRIALRNIIREVALTILLLIFGIFFPVLSPLIPVLILILQAYYAGFGNFDFTLERRLSVRESVHFVQRHRMLVIGNGIVFVLLLMTLVGFLFALPLGTAAAAVVVLEQDNDI